MLLKLAGGTGRQMGDYDDYNTVHPLTGTADELADAQSALARVMAEEADIRQRLDDAVNTLLTETLQTGLSIAGRFPSVAFSQVRCSV